MECWCREWSSDRRWPWTRKRLDQLDRPINAVVDKETDSLIISDADNRRVVRWPRRSNATSGETILNSVDCYGLTMDDQRCLYVSDIDKNEVRRYRMGETSGTIVAGGNGEGSRLNQLNRPTYIFVDVNHAVYVSGRDNHHVMKWVKGVKERIVVAGGRGYGNALTQLSYPRGVFVDPLGTVYVADEENHRVMRWYKGET
ncbi:unnamed protein product [Rotaria sp. Silwood2]|nr:unnamed protein product [Rotaria sp. Silwood2]CAF2901969.1 unnamed protein product [Rotaria sp. Silwood2]CAF3895518.1 unnamed protein product [Rotaria sp. Silwood2]CAF4309619.1 unnamed protein product [Rotaria sp. Silwood2]CAF4378864.1 unnamed protein product [Rotaria sp. Silwood2]